MTPKERAMQILGEFDLWRKVEFERLWNEATKPEIEEIEMRAKEFGIITMSPEGYWLLDKDSYGDADESSFADLSAESYTIENLAKDIRPREVQRAFLPPLFQKFDPKHSGLSVGAVAEVLDWEPTRNLVAYGPTGRGKTRSCYERLARACSQYIVADGDKLRLSPPETKGVFIVKWMDFNNRLPVLAKQNDGEREEYLSCLTQPGVLMIDDLGQGGFKPSAAIALQEIMDARYENNYITAATAQTVGGALLDTAEDKSLEVANCIASALRRLTMTDEDNPALEVEF